MDTVFQEKAVAITTDRVGVVSATMTSISSVQEHATAAFESMRLHGIGPSPENFTVWYHYHRRTYAELNRVIDALVKSDLSFDEEHNSEIYLRFFGNEVGRQVTLGAAASTERILQQVLERVGAARSNVADYAGFLRDTSDTLQQTEDVGSLAATLSGLIEETARIQQQNEVLERQLQNSSEEITVLRRDLETIQRDAETDGLTGISNRKRFDAALRERAREAAADDKPLCLIFADIDRFKQFNDLYGHQMGDQVLKLVARSLKDSIREGDLPARYGGEEFAVILPDASIEMASEIGERIRRTIASRRIVRRDSKVELGAITLSAGIALYKPGETLASLIDRADEALYVAKRSGRNKVVTEEQLRDPDRNAF